MHLVLYFCGTGNPGDGFYDSYDYKSELYDNNVRTIFVEGCDNKEVCNSGLFPNISRFVRRFNKKVFKKDGDDFKLTTTQLESLAVGINPNRTNVTVGDENKAIESITLVGYSRGAVTCFKVAKELDKIAPNVPVDIVANQPVPGNSYTGPGTNAGAIADCSQLKNLRNVSVTLAAYTGFQDGKKNKIHRGFFSQILPKLPRRTNFKKELTVITRAHHWQHDVEPSGYEHMHMQTAKYLHAKELLNKKVVDEKRTIVEGNYHNYYQDIHFPKVKDLQRVFGISRKSLYRYVDKLHPTSYLRDGYEWGDNELLTDWWIKHEKNTSRFKTSVTKFLQGAISHVYAQDESQDQDGRLIELFKRAEEWLIEKEGSTSSRYYQVTALRNNVYHRLINTYGVTKYQLDDIRYKLHGKFRYLLLAWQRESRAASYFKTDATRTLDQAFQNHSQALQSLANDKSLMGALDTWLKAKEGGKSKRYDLVIRMREQLQETVDAVHYLNKDVVALNDMRM